MWRILVVWVLVGLVGCVTAPNTKPDEDAAKKKPSAFPSPEDLAALSAKPTPERLFEHPPKDVEVWQLDGALPDQIGLFEPGDGFQSVWNAPLVKAASASGGKLMVTGAMVCLARQTARFHMTHDARPSQSLMMHMASRCGSPAASPTVGFLTADKMPEKATEVSIAEKWLPSLEKIIGPPSDVPQVAGAFFIREGERALMALAMGRPKVNLKPLSMLPDDKGNVLLQGELLVPAARVHAMVNHGAFGVESCQTDPKVALPAFSVICPTRPEDAEAWIDLVAFPAQRVLGKTVVHALVFPAGQPGDTYKRPVYDNPDAAPKGIPREDLSAALNRIRTAAGLDPLEVDTKQSDVADEISPHFFSAAMGQASGDVADQVVLGLQAGWVVKGIVRRGFFSSVAVSSDTSPSDMLAQAIERPYSRAVLLRADVQRLALGHVLFEQDGVQAATFTTYATFEGIDRPKASQALLERVVKLRADKGLQPPAAIPRIDKTIGKLSLEISTGMTPPKDALDTLMKRASKATGKRINGWLIETSDLEQVELPNALTGLSGVSMGILITHARPEKGEPWGRHVILIVAHVPETI